MLRGSGCSAAPAIPQAAAGEPSRGLHGAGAELQGGKETAQGPGMRPTDWCGGPTDAAGHTGSQWNHTGSQGHQRVTGHNGLAPPVVSPWPLCHLFAMAQGLVGSAFLRCRAEVSLWPFQGPSHTMIPQQPSPLCTPKVQMLITRRSRPERPKSPSSKEPRDCFLSSPSSSLVKGDERWPILFPGVALPPAQVLVLILPHTSSPRQHRAPKGASTVGDPSGC